MSATPKTRRLRLASPLVALLVTACGTTVQIGSTAPTGGGSADGLSLGGTATPGSARASSGQVTGSVPDASQAGSGAYASPVRTGGTAQAASGGQPTAATNSAALGPGVGAHEIDIGVAYFENAQAANDAIGGKGVEVSDPTATARAIVAGINRAGGISGRRVVPLFFGVDPQSATPYATEAQAECSHFTEDHKVFAVIDGTQAVGALARPCLESHGVAFTTDNTLVVSDVYPNEIDPDAIVWSRLFASLVPSLVRQHWLAPWNRTTGTPGGTVVKTGIVTADRPALNRAVDGVLIPLLRRAGHAPDPADVIRIAPPNGFGDDGATVAAIDNAALKLNADGVDHVILTDSNGTISLLFNNYAYSQHYFPRYGGTSGNFWQTLLTAGDMQPQTLNGALGIGFAPVLDVPFTPGRGPMPNTTRDRCLSMMRDAGLTPSSATVEASELTVCDAFLLLEQVLRGAATVNLDVLTGRVAALKGSFQPALALGDLFDPDQRDGIGAGVDFAFNAGCGCFHYTGWARRLAGARP